MMIFASCSALLLILWCVLLSLSSTVLYEREVFAVQKIREISNNLRMHIRCKQVGWSLTL
jgi:hypothetical protein